MARAGQATVGFAKAHYVAPNMKHHILQLEIYGSSGGTVDFLVGSGSNNFFSVKEVNICMSGQGFNVKFR